MLGRWEYLTFRAAFTAEGTKHNPRAPKATGSSIFTACNTCICYSCVIHTAHSVTFRPLWCLCLLFFCGDYLQTKSQQVSYSLWKCDYSSIVLTFGAVFVLGAGPDGVEEIKRHHFFSTIDWNVSFSFTEKTLSALMMTESSLVMILSLSAFPCPSDVPHISSRCRSCTAEKSTLLSSPQRGDLTTLSILIRSSQLKHPEVQAVTLPHLLLLLPFTLCRAELHCRINSCFSVWTRLAGGPAERQRPSAVQRVQLCGHNGGGDATTTQCYCTGTGKRLRGRNNPINWANPQWTEAKSTARRGAVFTLHPGKFHSHICFPEVSLLHLLPFWQKAAKSRWRSFLSI